MILNNVRLIDGTGRVWEKASVPIEDDRIAAVAEPVTPPQVTSAQELVPAVWKEKWAPMEPFLLD